MDAKKPQNGQYQKYDPPNVIPMSKRPAPVTAFLDSLRSAGLPESIIDQAHSVLSAIGVTDASLHAAGETVDRQTRRTVDWSKKNPQKAAGGFAAIVLVFGLLLILLERRR